MDDREIVQWDKRLNDQVSRSWENYKHLHIDLATARIDQSYLMAGEYLYVEDSSGELAVAKIKLNRNSNDTLDLEKGVSIETVFIEIFITNEALEDEWIDLVFGINFKYKKKIEILTRGLTKTGQRTEYQAGDDGTYEAGWWIGRLNADNRQRFYPRTIGGDDVVLDRATGLMWAADGNAAGCNNGNPILWANGIIYAEGLTFAGFTDWRLPNFIEIVSICLLENAAIPGVKGVGAPFINQNIFPNTGDEYWSGTTVPTMTTFGFSVDLINGYFTLAAKATASIDIRCVRLM